MVSRQPSQTSQMSDRLPSARSITSNSSNNIVCRICQSETGQMVKPCACDGSMGTIHERCLNQWWDTSGKDMCEICLTKYARTGRVLKPVKEWEKPKFGASVIYGIIAYLLVLTSITQMLWLIRERGTFERISASMTMRNHDWVRFLVLGSLVLCLLLLTYKFIRRSMKFFRRQYTVRFTEHEIHKQRKK